MKQKLTAIVLAAGKSTRMKTTLSKVLHPVRGLELILYPLQAISKLSTVQQIIVVVGHNKAEVVKALNTKLTLPARIQLDFVTQKEQKGTAHAVKVALPKAISEHIVILCGDSPLITAETLVEAEKTYYREQLDGIVLSTFLDDPAAYGRMIRDHRAKLLKITETRDIPEPERMSLKEVNSGMYFLNKRKTAEVLNRIKRNESKKEFYLTDIVEIFNEKGYNVSSFVMKDHTEMLSVNTLNELATVDKIMNNRLLKYWMREGVRFVDPESTFISHDTVFGQDTVVYPFVYIEKKVKIGNHCSVGPFIHLKDGVVLDDHVAVGNFLEVVRSRIKSFSKAKHFGYLGDVVVGNKVNIGAGTVIANYDGKNKNKTTIDNGAFIGSDTVLVAPVCVQKDAMTAAGSVVTKNVPQRTVVAGVPAKKLKNR